MHLPVTLPENQLSEFSFYDNGHICQGLILQGEMYEQIACFEVSNQLQAHALAHSLGEQGNQTVVSASHHQYKIWLSLRSEAAKQRRVALSLLQPTETMAPQPFLLRYEYR